MPGHRKGCDYDCGDADQEMDPAIEESFILRVLPGKDCDYLRKIIENEELNTDSDVSLEFKAQRKAILKIRGRMYAAVLVDLPCILEASKTLDKKNIIKTADVSQMLLVKQPIKKEEEIKDIELTAADRHYPDGLTPPMHDIRTKWPRRRHVDIRTMKHIRSEVNKQVEKLIEEDARAVSVSWVFEDAAPSRKDRLAGQDEDEDFDEWASSDDESDEDVGFEDHGVSANGTYVHAANDSDKQNESDPYMVSGGCEHDEEGAMESNFDELDAELFGYDSDAQTPCDDKTEQLASLRSGFPSAPREADANTETACDDKIEKLASLEIRIDDEKSAKTAKLLQKILDIHGELRNKTADLDKAKHPILRQRHQNALNTIHEKLKTARTELASLDADMALVELLASLNLQG
jgi:transcription initiation factor TFIID subunit 7